MTALIVLVLIFHELAAYQCNWWIYSWAALYWNKCSDRSMEVKLTPLLGNYDRPTDRSTDGQKTTSQVIIELECSECRWSVGAQRANCYNGRADKVICRVRAVLVKVVNISYESLEMEKKGNG